MIKSEFYKLRALEYAEKYGILEWKVKSNKMIYLVSYPKYLSNPAYTVEFTIDLDTFSASSRVLSRYYKKGLVNRH